LGGGKRPGGGKGKASGNPSDPGGRTIDHRTRKGRQTPDTAPDLSFLDDLNPEQREAATHTGGPLLVLAGAGSGKTRCLTYRFAYLVRCLGLDPGNILAITFTNKAAREMRDRVERLLGDGRLPGRGDPHAEGALWVSTFHATCSRLLRRDGERVGLRSNFVIYDDSDQTALLKEILSGLGWEEARWPAAGFLAAISRAKDELVGPEEFAAGAADFREERVAKVYPLYQEALRRNNAADFDDLIMKTVILLREEEAVLARLRERFRHVLVDEYQDTNHAQYVFVNLLAAGHRNLCVVGDDDQSIYAWRGADIRNVLEFEKDYPDARVIRLEQNYRSTKTILTAANAVIANNERRTGKKLWTENEAGDPVVYYLAADGAEEAQFVVGEILGGHGGRGLPLRSFAILYRTHAQSRAFEDVLVHKAVPYQIIGGTRFYERKEIKDVLAYLRVVHNPEDEVALERALGVPKRSIGPATLARLRQAADAVSGAAGAADAVSGAAGASGLLGGIRAVATGHVDPAGIGPKLRGELGRFVALIDALAAGVGTMPVTEMVREVAEKSGLVEVLRREGTAEAQSRIENIRELATVAANYAHQSDDPSLQAFLENAALMADIDVMKEGDDGVVLMTVHNAKGLEFPHVFVVGLEQGLFPHSRSLEEPHGVEEERRLCYVAMTRGMRRLYLTHARERTLYGYTMPAEPSAFLQEVPEETLFVASLVASRRVVERDPERARPVARTAPGTGVHPSATASATPRFSPGERVIHPRWGEGIIVGISRSGVRPGYAGNVHLRVAFANQGVQTIAAEEVTRKGK
jgi:DNA helicase-2/ATP-dependent DNA helicase PcrA